MSTSSIVEEIWCGSLQELNLDPAAQRVSLLIDVLDAGRERRYRVECDEVMELTFRNAIPGPWSYAEVTEAELTTEAGGEIVLRLMLWSEDAEVLVRCSAVRSQEQ